MFSIYSFSVTIKVSNISQLSPQCFPTFLCYEYLKQTNVYYFIVFVVGGGVVGMMLPGRSARPQYLQYEVADCDGPNGDLQ